MKIEFDEDDGPITGNVITGEGQGVKQGAVTASCNEVVVGS